MRSFERLRDYLLAATRQIPEMSMTSADDIWDAVVFVLPQEGPLQIAKIDSSLIASAAARQALAETVIPELVREHAGACVAFVSEVDVHVFAPGELPAAGPEDLVLLQVIASDRSELWSAPVTRHPERLPSLGAWQQAADLQAESFAARLQQAVQPLLAAGGGEA